LFTSTILPQLLSKPTVEKINMPEEKKWFVVYTKSNCEKKVSDLLSRKGVENYCPLNRVQRQWSDRKKIIFAPLFTSYVFVRILPGEQQNICRTDGILNFVYWLKKPAVIRDEEIDIIKRYLNDHSFVRLEKVSINVNDMVRITTGPFMEQEGQVVSFTNNSVKIMLPSLGYLMHVEIEAANVKIIHENKYRKGLRLAH
jgi:transcription antitermination factor NusG